jgi:flagellar biosynthesis/type III secretory pathway ATPase
MEKDASAPHVRNIRVHIFLCISLLKNIQLFTHSTTQEGKVVRMAGVHLDELEKAQRSMRVSIFNSTLRVMTRQKVIIHQGMFRVQVSCINIFLSFQNTYYIPLFYISFVIFHSLE